MLATPADIVHRDNFLPLRHAAALLVIYGHSHDLLPGANSLDLIARWLPGFKAGTYAVYLFFAISGYLVMSSAIRQPGAWRFVRNRALRIFPAYWVSLVICVAVLGPALGTLPAAEYFAHPGTREHLLGNLLPISFVWSLPGLFSHNPVPEVVNGSLWSLGLEMRWYAYLAVLSLVGAAQRRWVFTSIGLAFLCLGAWEWWIGKPDPLHYRALSMVFVGGALWAHWRARLPVTHTGMLATALLATATYGTSWFGPAFILASVHAVYWIAYGLPPLPWLGNRDYSFGLFLYGFPVQQSLVALTPGLGPLALCAWASLIALVLAGLSWHVVEQPALHLKRHAAIKRRPSPGPAVLPVAVRGCHRQVNEQS